MSKREMCVNRRLSRMCRNATHKLYYTCALEQKTVPLYGSLTIVYTSLWTAGLSDGRREFPPVCTQAWTMSTIFRSQRM